MTGKVLAIVAVVAACDAAIIPLSTNWPTQTVGTRSGTSGLSYLPNTGNLDYNQLFHVLYPDVTPDPLEDITLGLYGGLPQVGNTFEMNDFYKQLSPGVRSSSRLILPNRELTYCPVRGCGTCCNYEEQRNVPECRGDCRGCDDCRSCCQPSGNCDCRECGEERSNCEFRGCCEDRCMNECRSCYGCSRNSCQNRNNCECRGCCNQRNNMDCRNCCDCGECYSNCGCSKSASCSRSGSNCNRCESSGSGCQRNAQCSPCRCTKMKGQCCCNPTCY